MNQSFPAEITTDTGVGGALYTTGEVAKLLRVSQRTVQDWVRTGQLAAVKYGRQVRIRQRALDEFAIEMPRHEA